jgi:hypothetical protein
MAGIVLLTSVLIACACASPLLLPEAVEVFQAIPRHNETINKSAACELAPVIADEEAFSNRGIVQATRQRTRHLESHHQKPQQVISLLQEEDYYNFDLHDKSSQFESPGW